MISKKRVDSLQRFIILCLAAAVLAACEPSTEEVIAEHRAPVQAVFDRIKAIQPKVFAIPPLAEDQMNLGSEKVVMDGDASNALFIRAEDLAAPQLATSDDVGATYAGTIEVCGEALEGTFSGVSAGARLFLEDCARAEYLIVMRTHSSAGAMTLDKDSFQSGSYEGDVLLFRLADGQSLGGFRVSATNNDTVMAPTDASGNVTNAGERLDSDLSANVFVAIGDGLRKHVPGVLPAE